MGWWKEFFDPGFYGNTLEGLPEERNIREVDFMMSSLQLGEGSRLLDLCCGVGRHSIDIARYGVRVTGLDYNEVYLETARRKAEAAGVEVRFIKGDMRRIPPGAKYDAVINVFGSFGYFGSEAENFKVLTSVAGCLKNGGRFFFEIINREWVVRNYEYRTWFDDPGSITLEEHEFDPREDLAITRWKWIRNGEISEHESRIKLYPFSVLRRELEKRGLEIEYSFGDYDGSEYDMESGRMIIVARKSRPRKKTAKKN